MKKLLLVILLTGFLIPASYSQFTKIGASLGYNYRYYFNNEAFPDHKLKNPILSFNAIYEINLPFHIVPRLNIYFPNVSKFEEFDYYDNFTTSGYSLDLDGHYVFNSLDKYEIYGLAGINILYARRKWVYGGLDIPETKEITTNTELGLNLGAGAYWKVKDEFDLFMEAKLIVANQLQLVGNVGILLNMEYLWSKEKESGY